jgi:hypothetical protein
MQFPPGNEIYREKYGDVKFIDGKRKKKFFFLLILLNHHHRHHHHRLF